MEIRLSLTLWQIIRWVYFILWIRLINQKSSSFELRMFINFTDLCQSLSYRFPSWNDLWLKFLTLTERTHYSLLRCHTKIFRCLVVISVLRVYLYINLIIRYLLKSVELLVLHVYFKGCDIWVLILMSIRCNFKVDDFIVIRQYTATCGISDFTRSLVFSFNLKTLFIEFPEFLC